MHFKLKAGWRSAESTSKLALLSTLNHEEDSALRLSQPVTMALEWRRMRLLNSLPIILQL